MRRVESSLEIDSLHRTYIGYCKEDDLQKLEHVIGSDDSLYDFYDAPWIRHKSCSGIVDEFGWERDFLVAEVPRQFLGVPMQLSVNALSDHFARRGFRFAVETELVAFSHQHAWVAYQNGCIVALGATKVRDRDWRYVACLNIEKQAKTVCLGDHRRGLRPLSVTEDVIQVGHCSVGVEFEKDYRLLLVRKTPPVEM